MRTRFTGYIEIVLVKVWCDFTFETFELQIVDTLSGGGSKNKLFINFFKNKYDESALHLI